GASGSRRPPRPRSAIAGLPPLGSFFGRALIEDGATGGYRWLPIALTAASILAGAALPRAARRIDPGWGPDAAPPLGAEQASATALLAVGVGTAAWPALPGKAEAAALRAIDRRAHAAEVLEGKPPPHETTSAPAPSGTSIAAGLASAAGAIGLALLALFGGL